MLPDTLRKFASPIISKAMATGGRSSTTTTTNYGVVGDALMKKASLELDMASLKADMNMKMLEMKTNTEMHIMDVDMQLAKEKTAYAIQAEDNKMSDMGKIAATLQGVASGATIGFAAGGPVGAVVGGVAGGAMSAGAAYGPTDRARQDSQDTNQMLGSVAQGSVALRGMYDNWKGKKVYGDTSKKMGDLAGAIGSMGPGAERDAAIAKYDSLNAGLSGQLGQYFNPADAKSMAETIRSGSPAYLSADPVTRAKGEMAQLGIAAASDPNLAADAPGLQETLGQYHGKLNQLRGIALGDPTKLMGGEEFSQWAGGVRPDLGKVVSEQYQGSLSSMGAGGSGATARGAAPQGGYEVPEAPMQQPSRGQAVDHSGDYSASAPVQARNFTNSPPVGIAAPTGGVQMDDGTEFLRDPIGAIEKTNKLGEAGAQVFQQKEQEKMGFFDKVKHNMSLSDDEYEDKKIPTWKQQEGAPAQQRDENKISPELEARNAEEASKKNRDLDNQIQGNLESAKKSHLMSDQGLAKAEQIEVANDGLSKMENLVGKVPNDSQMKAMAAKVYLEGLRLGKTGQAMGATIGMSGGIAGVVAGNVVGDSLGEVLDGTDLGKGSATTVSKILSPSEIKAINEYHRVSSLAVPAMVKTADGNMVTNPEAKEMANNFFNYGQTKDMQLDAIRVMKENLLTKSQKINEYSAAGQGQFDYRQKMPIHYRATEQINKAEEEGFRRETGRQRGQLQSKKGPGWF